MQLLSVKQKPTDKTQLEEGRVYIKREWATIEATWKTAKKYGMGELKWALNRWRPQNYNRPHILSASRHLCVFLDHNVMFKLLDVFFPIRANL